ncbi:MAG TPA: hypothetical protein VFH99_01945 [Candidatus Saccharimonadales bacterium]|nr:hypothetical protein [Candidatus Saccharimonadales bacterium]
MYKGEIPERCQGCPLITDCLEAIERDQIAKEYLVAQTVHEMESYDQFKEIRERFEESPENWESLLGSITIALAGESSSGTELLADFFERHSRNTEKLRGLTEDAFKKHEELFEEQQERMKSLVAGCPKGLTFQRKFRIIGPKIVKCASANR